MRRLRWRRVSWRGIVETRRYRFPTGPLPVSVSARARVPDPRTARGPRRWPSGPSRWTEAARGARDPPAERESRRLGRTARRRPLRRRTAGDGGDAGAASDVGAAEGARCRPRSRHGRRATCSTSSRAGSTSTSSSAGTHDAAQALEGGDAQAASDVARSCARAVARSAARRSHVRAVRADRDRTARGACGSRARAALRRPSSSSAGTLQVLAELEALVWDHPLRERLRGLLMRRALPRGRQAEALDVYRKTRETLVAEFGIEPSPLVHELERRILDRRTRRSTCPCRHAHQRSSPSARCSSFPRPTIGSTRCSRSRSRSLASRAEC